MTYSLSGLQRFLRFSLVGAVGMVVQLVALKILAARFDFGYLQATVTAVEVAILHNFVWHEWFTWRDRALSGTPELLRRLLRLNLSTGAVSIGGNLILMRLLVGSAHLDLLLSNVITVVCCSALNFVLADRVVFVPQHWVASSTK